MVHTLVKNKKYVGKYVAMKDFGDTSIVGFGKTPHEAYLKASQKGYNTPVITYVPGQTLPSCYPQESQNKLCNKSIWPD